MGEPEEVKKKKKKKKEKKHVVLEPLSSGKNILRIKVSSNTHIGSCSTTKPNHQKMELDGSETRTEDLMCKKMKKVKSNICSICGKDFTSSKALFGHMRCHPDRDWRGMKPPSSSPSSSPPTSVTHATNTDAADKATMKRDRKGLVSCKKQKPVGAEREGAGGDALMSDGDDGVAERLNKRKELDGRIDDSVSKKVKGSDERGVGKSVADGLDEVEDEIEKARKHRESVGRKAIGVIVEYMKKSLAQEEEEEAFKCDICDKCFPSHQALGGHKSSHSKSKGSVAVHPQLEANADHEIVSNSKAASNCNLNGSKHQCKICEKAFLTGQALGGHMRLHWSQSPQSPASNTSLSIEPAVQETMSSPDLSIVPAVQETMSSPDLSIVPTEPEPPSITNFSIALPEQTPTSMTDFSIVPPGQAPTCTSHLSALVFQEPIISNTTSGGGRRLSIDLNELAAEMQDVQ